MNTEDLRIASSGKGSYAAQWKRDPQRIVELLCMEIERIQCPGLITQDYWTGVAGDGPQAAQWKDKPHRLVYDLCEEIERLRALRPHFLSWKVRWLRTWLGTFVVLLILPFVAAVLPSGGAAEQVWLDQVIVEVERRRDTCDDPELRELLDYTARRYNRIGRFNVAIRYCGPLAIGINMPHCPGVTLDSTLIKGSPQFGADILVHEARHDYFPYLFHTHFDLLEK